MAATGFDFSVQLHSVCFQQHVQTLAMAEENRAAPETLAVDSMSYVQDDAFEDRDQNILVNDVDHNSKTPWKENFNFTFPWRRKHAADESPPVKQAFKADCSLYEMELTTSEGGEASLRLSCLTEI